MYGQDDWKVSPKLSLNLGLRYQPMTNPVELHDALYSVASYTTSTGFEQVPHVMIVNPSWKNFDPRVGLAYDLFADHKTSIRAGFGMFHEVLSAGIWGIGFINAPPWNILSQTCPPTTSCIPFTNPSYRRGCGAIAVYGRNGGGRPFPASASDTNIKSTVLPTTSNTT